MIYHRDSTATASIYKKALDSQTLSSATDYIYGPWLWLDRIGKVCNTFSTWLAQLSYSMGASTRSDASTRVTHNPH